MLWIRCESYGVLTRCLFIGGDRILESSVCRGMHNLTAAPEGPDTLPCEATRAASILSRSGIAPALGAETVDPNAPSALRLSHASSTENASPSDRMTERSMTF